ncbi:MAG: T9SS type A sorting domain-containing protein [Ignavibacteriales bacterium]|nr:T9SS type A sorting domain-containing protein [Ignavibacteriales bacterium]
MKPTARFYLILFFVIAQSFVSSQVVETSGHLAYYDILSKNLIQTDLSLTWKNSSGKYYSYSYYTGGFRYNSSDYLYYHSSGSFGYTSLSLIKQNGNCIGNKLYGYFGELDVWEPYLYINTEFIPTNSGVWILNGVLENKFMTPEDSLKTTSEKFVFISGMIKNSYLVTKSVNNNAQGNYFLASLDSNQKIIYGDSIAIIPNSIQPSPFPYKLLLIHGNKFLIETPQNVSVCSFTNNKIIIDKPLFTIINIHRKVHDWTFNNGWLYYVENRSLIKAKVDTINNSITNSKVLLSGIGSCYGISQEKEYISAIVRDTLFTYSTSKENFVVKFSLKGVDYTCPNIVVTTDKVYIHVIDTKTTIYDKPSEIPPTYTLSQNYPNPFNPETTIEFTIPVVDANFASTTNHVTLKVYDVLGREAATLVDEYKSAGNYKVTFNTRHLERSREMNSGVYFYQLRAGSFVKTKKLVLLK